MRHGAVHILAVRHFISTINDLDAQIVEMRFKSLYCRTDCSDTAQHHPQFFTEINICLHINFDSLLFIEVS